MFVCDLTRGIGHLDAIGDRAAFASWRRERSSDGAFTAFVAPGSRARTARVGQWLAVGEVRLDVRAELDARVPEGGDLDDLALVLSAIAADGDLRVDLLGDFAFVAYDASTRACISARDPFGVKALFVKKGVAKRCSFASQARHLAGRDPSEYDLEFVASYLAGLPPKDATMWRRVRPHTPATVIRWGEARTESRLLWSPARFPSAERGRDEERCDELGVALREAVRARTRGRDGVHAQLSGGLDSSSIVCLAAELAEAGDVAPLDGTITWVDPLGDANEEEFSDAVSEKTKIRTTKLRGLWPYMRDGLAPPENDVPSPSLPWFVMHRRICAAVSERGGAVLLSGLGADQVLDGCPLNLADDVARGRLRSAASELFEHAVATRSSFWTLGMENVIAPLLGRAAPRSAARSPQGAPAFLTQDLVQRTHLRGRLEATRAHPGAWGGKFDAMAARELEAVPWQCEREPFDQVLEMRYPFLDRRVVEIALALPARLRVGPGARKRALREAMRGTLPESVRTRTTKCGPDARVAWAFTAERAHIDALLAAPLSADLGWVEPSALRDAVERIRGGDHSAMLHAGSALGLEMWLRGRHGATALYEDSAPNQADGRLASLSP